MSLREMGCSLLGRTRGRISSGTLPPASAAGEVRVGMSDSSGSFSTGVRSGRRRLVAVADPGRPDDRRPAPRSHQSLIVAQLSDRIEVLTLLRALRKNTQSFLATRRGGLRE